MVACTGCRLLGSPTHPLPTKTSRVPDVILRLALPSPLRRLFDYRAPAAMARQTLTPGMRIRVPFGRREMIGVLVEVCAQSEVPADKLKPASELLDPVSPLPPELFKLCLWTAHYYQHSLGDTLSWALPVLLRQGEAAPTRASPAPRARKRPCRPSPSIPMAWPTAC